MGSKPEVFSRIAQTTAAETKLKVIWNDKNIAISSKIKMMRSLVMSIFCMHVKRVRIRAGTARRIQTLKMRYFRRLLSISYRDHINDEELKTRIGNAIGPYEGLLTSMKRRKLKWHGHVTRSFWTGPRPSYWERYKEGDEEADRGNDGKTTSLSGLALNGTAYC